jgi:putative transposase
VTGLVNQQLLMQNEYLVAENRILRAQLPRRLRFTDPQRYTLAEIGKRLGRIALEQVACVVKPETILGWYRRLIAQKFDGSRYRSYPGRPPIGRELSELVVRMARENPSWGYDRIVGALSNLGQKLSDQTVGNILRRYGIPPARKRSGNTTWKDFIAAHMAVLAGADFFTVEVLTWRGLVTYYVLFFLHLETRRVSLAGITWHPTERVDGANGPERHRRDVGMSATTTVCSTRPGYEVLQGVPGDAGVKCLRLPARSPNLNAFAERWVRSVKEECLSKLILFGEGSLTTALKQFQQHYLFERNHQGKGNILLFTKADHLPTSYGPSSECQRRLGGLLKYYYWWAA